MKSNEKKLSIITRIKKAYRKFMYKEPRLKELEEYDKLPFKEKLKINSWKYIGIAIILSIAAYNGIFCLIHSNNETNQFRQEGVKLEKQLKGLTRNIESGDLTKYMIDTINNSYIKIAQTKLDDKVAYSLTYRYDVIPEGEMTQTSYFAKGKMSAILINGYPNVTYQELGLNNEEEAYIATQLAVYALVSDEKYSMAIGEFSLDAIKPSEEKYSDMVERVVAKAKELYNLAIENPYEISIDYIVKDDTTKMTVDGNESLVGPIAYYTITDNTTKEIMGDAYNPSVNIDVVSHVEGSQAFAINENGEKVTSVENGETFYIKIIGTEKVFTQCKVTSTEYFLRSEIYEQLNSKKKYVLLEPQERIYEDVVAAYHNVDVGNVNLNFKTEDGSDVEIVSYKIYDENHHLIQDMKNSGAEYGFVLPVGKYYIEVYDVPEKYFLENSNREFEITKDAETDLEIIFDSL